MTEFPSGLPPSSQTGSTARTAPWSDAFCTAAPPERIADAEGIWELQATFVSSGEAECPQGTESVEEERCPLCDEARGQSHGYIYLGDGWAEAVFRNDPRNPSYDDELDG
jgi:hypothetical protein